ncbi:dipeptide ABC transporter ATP-binding protein [Vannielia litorea]|uniref:dipeptide ABC transporter ATP-binding protein n=1 Tax=Vannielia litorea TaxID=1217970 RepID=UPI001C982D9A|nr:ABC transporter ATP-binding protein [Vannielia litorea]MBY6046318.1 ABC transporter ATP-binding protein [Vannielia litorea]MBY6073731.1 ABC transporter ATP-binding protein [Vannielia litorea]
MTPLLKVENLSIAFRTRNGEVTALHDVSFEVGAGEVVGVVGESGSGKSVSAYTTIGLLDQAGRVAGGSVSYDGKPLLGQQRPLRGREISMIFQNPRAALNPIMTVGQQLSDVLKRHALAGRTDAKAKAIDLLRQVQINDPEERYNAYPFELSGGMCQRVMIALALACSPRLLIADEPTTGLDVTTQKTTMDLMRELTRARGMSVVLITHDLGMAAEYCDRIVVMEKGRVVESAPVRQLFTAPRHPYTQKLIAASPGPDSRLEDLTRGQLEAPAKITPTPQNRPGPDRLLEVVNLVKEFPRRGTGFFGRKPAPFRAVDGISFELRRGESLGLVGESGCGKSTTSSIIARLQDATSGSVIFDGHDILHHPAQRFARMPQRGQVQMVFQDSHDSLDPRWSASDVIAQPLRRIMGMKDAGELSRRTAMLAEMVGLPGELLSRYPHQLSGGQKARVNIARAIATDPLLLILDEPTSALDVSVQAVVLQLLDRLRRELGMSYIFVSHDLNVVRLLCERTIVMNRGKIVEEGSAEQVLHAPRAPYTQKLVAAIPHFEPEKLRVS